MAFARADEIEKGASWPAQRLRDFVDEEQSLLVGALSGIPADRWRTPVTTAHGRILAASTIPWLRSREVWIHACDLPSGGDFTSFPDDFIDALIGDALQRRRTAHKLDIRIRITDRPTKTPSDNDEQIPGTAADVARWLTRGGPAPALRTADGAAPPDLPPWL